MPVSKTAIRSEHAPAPPPFLSQAIIVGDLVYVSGCLAMDPTTGEIVGETMKDRTAKCLTNVFHILEAAGSSPSKTVKVNIFLADMKDYADMNEAYIEAFKDTVTKPARTCVAVKQLPKGADVEIEAVAHL